MSYVNTGAYVDGKRPASKAALKRALAENGIKMAVPTVMLFLGFLILVGYPAVSAVLSTL